MKALLKYDRQSPRKVRLIADMIRGKKVEDALAVLKHTPKKATVSLEKLLKSALANAKENSDKKEGDLYIKEVTVNKGFTMKRARPRAFGRAFPIRKHTSQIMIVLSERSDEKGKVKKEKSASRPDKAPNVKATEKSKVKKAAKAGK